MTFYKEAIEYYFEEVDYDPEYLTEPEIEGYELAEKFFKTRMEAVLKQYNNDSERAFDLYSIKNILEHFNLYANELYLLDKSLPSNQERSVSKILKNVHNHLQLKINRLEEYE